MYNITMRMALNQPIQNLYLKNIIILRNKMITFQSSLPKSICNIYQQFTRNFEQRDKTPATWIEKYNTLSFRNSIIFKGPLLYLNSSTMNSDKIPYCKSVNSHKKLIKNFFIVYQCNGDPQEFHGANNILLNINGTSITTRNKNWLKVVSFTMLIMLLVIVGKLEGP